MEGKETVCAVVVTYNRKKLLLECLDALSKQTRPVDAIYIIDNFSSDGTPELLLENGYIDRLPPENLSEPFEMEITSNYKPKVYYVRMHENTGGAGGFHEGVKRGYERGYDWLWLMDDDAEPYCDSLELLLDYSNVSKLLCPLIIGLDKPQIYHHKRYNQSILKEEIWDIDLNNVNKIHANAFVGPLICRTIVANIGLPIKEYFIWSDDTEYTFRANKYTNILLVPFAKIKHKDEQFVNNKVNINALWKQYYGYRNKVHSIKKHALSNKKYLYISYLFFKSLFDSIKYLRHFFSIKSFIHVKGFVDGIFNRLGKKIDPKNFIK